MRRSPVEPGARTPTFCQGGGVASSVGGEGWAERRTGRGVSRAGDGPEGGRAGGRVAGWPSPWTGRNAAKPENVPEAGSDLLRWKALPRIGALRLCMRSLPVLIGLAGGERGVRAGFERVQARGAQARGSDGLVQMNVSP